MKLSSVLVAAVMVAEARINVNFGQGQPENSQESSKGGKTKSLDADMEPDNEPVKIQKCCDMIESHVFGRKRSYRHEQDQFGRDIWTSNDGHRIIFNEILEIWQVVNDDTTNPVGEAFAHASDATMCPNELEWTVKNIDSWGSVKNFARCQGNNEHEQNAFRLSHTVCDLIQQMETSVKHERARTSMQKRKNTLCNRAMNHARRVIRQKKCTVDASSLGRSMKTFYAVDTVKQWRDQLQTINAERNENCTNKRGMNLLNDALDRFYESTRRLFLKQNW